MALADELIRLEQLHARGALTNEEFAGGGDAGQSPAAQAINRLRRSRTDRWLGGVCGGMAASTGIDSWAWRLIMVVLALFGGAGVLLYVLLWIFVPSE
jgi:phage shock protein C